MGTKLKTSSTNQYNQPSLNDYQSLASQSGAQLGSQISSPYNNSVINGQRAVASPLLAASRASTGSTTNNQQGALGTSGGTSYNNFSAASDLRQNASTSAKLNTNLLIGAATNRNTALGAAMSFRPLQTGGTQTQSTTGAGTWVAPVVGAVGAGLSAYQQAQNGQSGQSSVPNGNADNGLTSYAQPGGEEGQFSGGTGTGSTYNLDPSQAATWGGNASPGGVDMSQLGMDSDFSNDEANEGW